MKCSFLVWLRVREAGYFAKLVAAFVKASPKGMFKYVSANAAQIIADLARNMMHVGTCDAVRFLLDIPLLSMQYAIHLLFSHD